MKILECKRGQIYDIGFIDPYYNHHQSLATNPRETENNLVQGLRFSGTKREILFSLQLQVSVTTHILFSLTRCYYKCILDSLCERRFHFILLIIVCDEGLVKVMDPKRTPLAEWANMQECLQRQFQSL